MRVRRDAGLVAITREARRGQRKSIPGGQCLDLALEKPRSPVGPQRLLLNPQLGKLATCMLFQADRRSNQQATGRNKNVSQLKALIRSIQLSPIATLITDYQAEDNPIVGANSAFCTLTGYREEELVGRNCRLLGGPGTEEEPRRVLRAAIMSGQPALTELTNYKRDGTQFCNAVMIAPVKDSAGKITHYLGSQMEVRREGQSTPARRQHIATLIASLTNRQSQVLDLMVRGHRNREIAAKLGVKEATVKLHRAILMERLGAKTAGDAVRMAMEARYPDKP